MADIDVCADVLDEPQRRVWAAVAETAGQIDGCLMGGTAVAVHLRHRRSEDLNVMTLRDFSAADVQHRLERRFKAVQVIDAGDNYCTAVVEGVRVDVFKALIRSSVGPLGLAAVAPGPVVCGMPVASVPDLLASKLEILRFRAKVRDLIDLAAIDQLSGYSLEDGLGFYCRRYGHDRLPQEFNEIIALLQDPEPLDPDPSFDQAKPAALAHLQHRAVALAREAAHHYALEPGREPTPSRRGEPLGGSGPLGASEYLAASGVSPTDSAVSLPVAAGSDTATGRSCGSVNTYNGAPCKLPEASCPYDEHRRSGRRQTK